MCDLELNYLCTYKLITEDGEDEKGLSDLMYNLQYLQMFGLSDFDENKVNEKMSELYNKIEKETFLDELFEVHPYKLHMGREAMFRILFSYDYLDLFHKVLYNYFNKLPINESIQKVKNQLKYTEANTKTDDTNEK